MTARFDHVVIGAGSSGAVIAARLATCSDRRVLLIEAGPDYPNGDLPQPLRDGRTPALASHDWGVVAHGTAGRRMWLPRGKVVGGCSSINTCIALRPDEGDFLGWPSIDDVDWTWTRVLNYFRRIETDLDYEEPYHGDAGPLPISRPDTKSMTPVSRAFIEYCRSAGFPIIANHNQPGSTGAGVLPLNLEDSWRRISTSTAFLWAARGRRNLHLLPNALVDKVIFEGTRAVGIKVVVDDLPTHIPADDIILCGGAFGTPSVLLRSGIGPSDDLRYHGIAVVADLSGVGANLTDHSQVPVICAPKHGAILADVPCAQVVLRYRAPDSPYVNDMQLYLLNHVDIKLYAPEMADTVGGDNAFIMTSNLMAPQARGCVRLRSRNPSAALRVDLDYLASAEDRRRHREGIRLAWEAVHSEWFEPYLTSVVGLDSSTLKCDEDLDRYIAATIQTAHHPTGTAKIGDAEDPAAVVDAECHVYGTRGLRVADASIIPNSIRANTNLSCIMIGERVADLILGTR